MCSISDTAKSVANIGIGLEWIGAILCSGGNISPMKRSMDFVPMRSSDAKFSTTPNQIRTVRSPICMCSIIILSNRTGCSLDDRSPIFGGGPIFDLHYGGKIRALTSFGPAPVSKTAVIGFISCFRTPIVTCTFNFRFQTASPMGLGLDLPVPLPHMDYRM